MAQTIKLRRSAVAGNRPTTAQLDLGELAINTVDGKIYFEKSASGVETIQEIFTTNATNSGSLTTIGDVTVTGSLNVSGSTIQIGNNTLAGNTVLSGSVVVSGSLGVNASLVSIQGPLRLDPAQDPGTQNITASFLFTSASNTSTGYDLYYRQSDNIVKFKWLEGGISTGLLYGGVITYSGTTINVSKGSAIVNNLNASTTSEVGPIFKYVQWDDYSEPAEYLETEQNTFIYVDDSGVIHQQPNYFTSTQYSHSIPLGRVTHANYTSITGAGSNVQTTYDSDQQQNAFIRAFGPIKINGLTLAPHASGMRISIGSGETFNLGGFYPQDPNHPSSYVSNAFPTASIARAYRSGSTTILDNNGGSFYTTIDSQYWDDGTGTLNTMASGDWQIQRVFVNPVTGRTVVYYGQHGTYSTLLNALQYLATDPFVEGEFTAKSLVFVGYIVLRGNTSNLADTNNNVFIQAGTFRNTAGSSGGASVISLTLDGISDVTTLNPTNGQALVYNSGVWENGTPISASHAGYVEYTNIGNKPTLVSGSSQLTSSYDLRYTLSGSITQTTWDNISGKPDGIISSSAQLPSGLVSGSDQLTSSYDLRYALSGSVGSGGGVSAIYIANQGVLQGTASYFDFNGSGVYATINDNTASIQITGGGGGGGVYNSYFAELSQSSAANTWSFFHDLGVEHPVVTIYDESNQVIQPLSIEALTTSSMEIVFSSARKGYAVATIGSALPFISASYEGYSLKIVDGAPMWAVSSSTVATASYVEYSNVRNKPTLVSGSSQLTSSYDERYVLSGSITQTTWDNIANKPGGIISGAAQLPQGIVSSSSNTDTIEIGISYGIISANAIGGIVSGSSQIILQNTTGQLSASRVDGLNLSQIATGSWTASVANDEFNIIHEGSNIFSLNSGSTTFDNGLVTIIANSFANDYAEGYSEFGDGLLIQGNEIISGALSVRGDIINYGTTTISGSLIVSGTLDLENANIDNSRYLHVQSEGATTWTVNHNLEYNYPNVIIWDSTGNVIIPDSIVRVSNNQLTIGFTSNESGWAHVSVGGISTGQADRFLYTQATEESTWTINHGLNYKYVNVNVYDDNDEMLLPQTITATNENTITLVFATPTAGNAIISKGGARTTSAFTEFGNGVYGLSGSLNVTGSIVASGDVDAQNFNTTSDLRLKTNLEVITGALDKVEQLNAYTYDWIEEYNNEGIRQIGLVSQEVQKVQPELVHEKEVVVGNVTERMLLLDYSKVTTLLIGAVKELSEKVKQLENKIGE